MSLIDKYRQKSGRDFAKQVIRSYMIKNKMNVEEFMKKNPDINTFDQNTRLLGIVRTHGYFIMSNEIYKELLQELKAEEEAKKKLDNEAIETVHVNGKELVTYTDKQTGEQITVDNTVSNKDFKQRMAEVQGEHKQFQDTKANNTLNVVNYMKDNINITPNTQKSSDIKLDDINEELRQIAICAKAYERAVGHHVDIDLETKTIYDNGSIYSIEKRGDTYQVFAATQTKKKQEKKNNKAKTLVKQNNNIPGNTGQVA
jgi:hypothetical protein